MTARLATVAILAAAVLLAPVLAQTTTTPSSSLRDARSLRTEPYAYIEESSNGQYVDARTLVQGLTNIVKVHVANPLANAVNATLTLENRDFSQSMDPVVFPVNLSAKTEVILEVPVEPSGENSYFGFRALIHSDSGLWTGTSESNLDFNVVPPVSVRLVSPAPLKGLATIKELYRGGGGSGPGGDIVFVSPNEDVVFEAEVENHGDTTQSLVLRLTGDESLIGDDVSVMDLDPGDKRTVQVGHVTPLTLNPKLLSDQGQNMFWFYVGRVRPDASADQRADPVVGFEVRNGTVRNMVGASVVIQALARFNVDVYAPATIALGKAAQIQVRSTDFTGQGAKGKTVTVTFYPPYRASYAIQRPEASEFQVDLGPGDSRVAKVSLTPLIAGRWDISAEWEDSNGPNGVAENVFSIDVPTLVDLRVPSPSTAKFTLGGSIRAPLLVHAKAALPDAKLQIAIGSADASNNEGGFGGPVKPSIAGLSAQVVSAQPSFVDLGSLRLGEERWFNITLESRGVGTYYVVPYVVSGKYAYTGQPAVADPNSLAETSDDAPALTVTVAPWAVPPVVAFLPAAVALAGAFLIHVVRHRWIR